MSILQEFREWLHQWFRRDEVEAMTERPWGTAEGVKIGGRIMMNIEEFLQLAAAFLIEREGLSSLEVQAVANGSDLYIFDLETRTVLAAAAYQESVVEPAALERFLAKAASEIEESKPVMAVRALVEC